MLRYLQITKTSFLNRSYYRFEIFFDAAKGVVMALVIVAVWREVFRASERIGGYTLEQMVVYTCAAAVVGLLFNIDVAHYVSGRVRRGDIAFDLVRPVDYFLLCLSDHLGWALYSLVFAVLPTLVALALLFDLGTVGPGNWCAAALLAVPGFLLYYLFSHICALSTFYTVDAWGIEFFRLSILRFFAGGFVPVSLFPEPLATLGDYLPFKYMIYAPAAALAGDPAADDVGGILALQALWVLALLIMDQASWRVVVRKVLVHGG